MLTVETSLKEAMTSIEGSLGVALVDYTSGMALGTLGGGKDLDLSVAAAGNTDVIRAKVRTMEMLDLRDDIEDMLITLGSQYHLIRLLGGRGSNGLFLYLVLDKARANLAMARHQLKRIEAELELSPSLLFPASCAHELKDSSTRHI
ncbi:hypothetical protein SNARM312S_02255 [Streptomyces narbonensis]